jgi:ABC-type antimicrobial peptide transport system permease subunit
VSGDDIASTRRENFINSLAGRIPGAIITATTGMPGASSTIVLRGPTSIDGSNQPLFVVDGLIIDNSSFEMQDRLPASGGLNLANRSNDFGNRAMDINPEDIDSDYESDNGEPPDPDESAPTPVASTPKLVLKKLKSADGKEIINLLQAITLYNRWVQGGSKKHKERDAKIIEAALAASIRTQIDGVFTEQFKGDYAISTTARGFGGLSPSLADDINLLPEVERATGIGLLTVKIEDRGQYLTTINPATAEGVFDLGLTSGTYADLTADTIFVSEQYAENNDSKLGDTIAVTLADAQVKSLSIAGIYEFDEIAGKYTVSRDIIKDSTVINFDLGVYIKTKPGISDESARAVLQAAVDKYGQGTLLSKREYIDSQSGQINQLLGLIYGLLFLSVIIAVVGIIITLLLSVFERQREIGLLRAVGMTKSQVRTTVRWESVITSLLGAVVGIVLGVGLGWVIVYALRDQGLSSFSVPISSTVSILIMAFVIGVLAAVYPAWRATRVNLLTAITTS